MNIKQALLNAQNNELTAITKKNMSDARAALKMETLSFGDGSLHRYVWRCWESVKLSAAQGGMIHSKATAAFYEGLIFTHNGIAQKLYREGAIDPKIVEANVYPFGGNPYRAFEKAWRDWVEWQATISRS